MATATITTRPPLPPFTREDGLMATRLASINDLPIPSAAVRTTIKD